MKGAQNIYTLPLEIEFAGPPDQHELETYVQQYASELCADLAIPAIPAVSLKPGDPKLAGPPFSFPLRVNGQVCRPSCWPLPVLPERPSAQDCAEFICVALFDRREFMLTNDLVHQIAVEWGLVSSSDYLYGWSSDGFRYFLRSFLRYHFSLRHARRFIDRGPSGVTSESHAAYLFEEAMEESVDFRFGPSITICKEDIDLLSKDEELGRTMTRNFIAELGFLFPQFRIIEGILALGEFQLQLNELHLPLIRGLSRLTELVTANAGSLLVSATVHLLLNRLSATSEKLVANTRKLLGELPAAPRRLTVILRRLLDEQVPIADLAGILESLLSLRSVTKDGESSVYHFSELEDSPILVAPRKSLSDLTADDFVAAARLGVKSLAVRKKDKSRQVLPLVPLPSDLQTALANDGSMLLAPGQNERIVECLKARQPENCALIVDQGKRATIRERLRYEFPTVPVFGWSEVPKSFIAEGFDALWRAFYTNKRFDDALVIAAQSAAFQPLPANYLHLKLAYDQLGRPASEKPEYKLASQLAHEPGWQVEIADSFFRRRYFRDAGLLYRDLVAIDPENAPNHFKLLADCQRETGAFRKAIDSYKHAPDDAQSHADLAAALTAQGDYVSATEQKRKWFAQARGEFQRAIDINPTTAGYHRALSVPLARLRLWELACNSLREAVRLDPKDVLARRELANCLSQQRLFNEAIAELEKLNPPPLEIKLDLARAYAQAERFDDALKQAEELSKQEVPAKQSTLDVLDDLKKAQQAAAQIKAGNPTAAMFASLGDLQAKLGNLQPAIEQYRKAVTLDASTASYYKRAGNMLYKLEDWPGAAAAWEQVRKLDANDALNLNNLGTAYDGLERTQDAKVCYQQAAGLVENQFVPRFNLGGSNYRLKDFEAARDAYLESMKLRNDFAGTHFHLGNCYCALNHQEDAITEWETASQLDPKHVESRFNLAVALWATAEKRDKATDYWKQALNLDPNLTFAEDNLSAVAENRDPPHLSIFDLVHTRGSEEAQAISTAL